MIWDTKALTLAEWERDRDVLLADGWEVRKIEAGTVPAGCAAVYLRRPFVDK